MSLPTDINHLKKLLASAERILTESVSGPEAAKHVEGQSPAPAAKSEPGEVSSQGRKSVESVAGDNAIPHPEQSPAPKAHVDGGEASSQGPRTVRSVSEWHDRMFELASLTEMTGPEAAKHVEGQSPAQKAKEDGGQAIQQGSSDVRSVAGGGSGEAAAGHVEGQAKAPEEKVPAEAGARSEGNKGVKEAVHEAVVEEWKRYSRLLS